MDYEVQFEALKSLRGRAYTALRDEILLTVPDPSERFLGHRRQATWQDNIHTRILRGWLDRRTMYDAVLSNLDAEDVHTARKTVPGLNGIWNGYAQRAAHDLGAQILPLCWEAVLKYADDLPRWQVIAFLRMLGAVPDPLSVEPLLEYIAHVRRQPLRAAAAQALSAIPRSAIEGRIHEERARHVEVAEILDDILNDGF